MDVMKKIIFVQFLDNYSGSPRVLLNTIQALRSDSKTLLITGSGPGFLSDAAVPEVRIFFRLFSNRIIASIAYLWMQVCIFLTILLRSNRGDIIFINTVVPFSAAIAGKLKGCRIVFHLHEDFDSLNIIHRIGARIGRKMADLEIFVSEYLKEKMGKDLDQSIVVYNSLPKKYNEAFSMGKKNQFFEGRFYVYMICSLRDYKGIPEFLTLARSLLANTDVRFRLVLSEPETKIESYFMARDVPANVEIFPECRDVRKHLQIASLVLNLSRPESWVETFGLTLIEGMSFGVPSITPKVGGPPEIIKHGVHGYNIDCRDTDQIVSAILKLKDNPELFHKMSLKCVKKSSEFSFERYSKRIKIALSGLTECEQR